MRHTIIFAQTVTCSLASRGSLCSRGSLWHSDIGIEVVGVGIASGLSPGLCEEILYLRRAVRVIRPRCAYTSSERSIHGVEGLTLRDWPSPSVCARLCLSPGRAGLHGHRSSHRAIDKWCTLDLQDASEIAVKPRKQMGKQNVHPQPPCSRPPRPRLRHPYRCRRRMSSSVSIVTYRCDDQGCSGSDFPAVEYRLCYRHRSGVPCVSACHTVPGKIGQMVISG